jgi:hypothetical protein
MAALTFEEFDTPAAGAPAPRGGALTFEEFDTAPSEHAGVLGNLGMGALKGAADIGTTLLRPIDAALNAIGATDMTNVERRQALDAFFREQADPESLAFKAGEVGTQIAGTAGVGGALGGVAKTVAPTMSRLPVALESFGATAGAGGSRLVNAATRVGAGAATGAASSGLIDPESAGTGAVLGGVLGPAMGVAGKLVGEGAGWLSDAVRGRLGAIRAGQLARDAAGPELSQIRAANAAASGPTAGPGLTSGQATASVDRDMWQALARLAEKNDPDTAYRLLSDAQEAARRSTLAANTPDLAAAEAARKSASLVNYRAAEAAQFHADPVLAQLATNPFFKKAQAASSDLTAAQKVDFQTNPTAYLNNVKFGLDKMLGMSGDTALGDSEKQAVAGLRRDLTRWMERKNPAYRTARLEHARLSEPINQAQVMGEMQNTLQRAGGGERVQPFLDAMGRGENALLKRADQSPRFGGVEDVLTPTQLKARERVAGELVRDRKMAEMAAAGEGGLKNLLAAQSGLPRLPSFLSVVASATNKAIQQVENKIERGTLEALVKGMLSGASANELLSMTPAAERSKVAQWLALKGPQRYILPEAAQVGQEAP